MDNTYTPYSEPEVQPSDATAASTTDVVDQYVAELRNEIAELTKAKDRMVAAEAAREAAQQEVEQATAAYKASYAESVKNGYPEAVLAKVGLDPIVDPPKARTPRKNARRGGGRRADKTSTSPLV
ncbi:hypothetical protein [Gordonia malaquae]|uniref:hypothetical protein n=1 Tax=Gordonia malaquae TaxID=410332 RepID=UPI003018D581